MKINLEEIFAIQTKLDQTIYANHNVNYLAVKEKIVLALAVELGELANEVRCFKYWSKKEPSVRDVILEEYVDGIHFITSIANNTNVSSTFDIKETNKNECKEEVTELFNDLFFSLKHLRCSFQVRCWYKKYLKLGMSLGFTVEEIKKAYFAKNEINFKRQETNY